jgi:hypothetical protein
MELASLDEIRQRLKKRVVKPYKQPKDYLKNTVRMPRKLKHNAGDGGEFARTYMSDYATS